MRSNLGRETGVVIELDVGRVVVVAAMLALLLIAGAGPNNPVDPKVKGTKGVCFLCNLGTELSGSASLTNNLGRAIAPRFIAETGATG